MKTLYIKAFLLLLISGQVLQAQKSEVNTDQSTVKWTGKKIGTDHYGYIQIKEGYLETQNGTITGGTFLVDMTSISNVDVENEEFNKKLVGHLKSDDFFGVEKYPTSKLVISESTPFRSGKATVRGQITIKGITQYRP